MAGILKVDTIQRAGSDSDQITLSANTVTIGGTTLKVPNSVQTTTGKTILNNTGSVLQVVQSVKLDRFQGQASTLTDITGTDQSGSGSIFCCKITPSSTSNKILVTLSMGITATDAGTGVSLVRDSTEIYKGAASGSKARLTIGPVYGSGSNNNVYSIPVSAAVFLDSPSSTSELVYKPQYFSRGSSNFNLGHTIYNTDNDNATRVPSSITLMEIVG